jgi:hypothetical protein
VNRKLIRRQLILLLILAGMAYLWWQSLTPGRYAEWAEDLGVSNEAQFAWPADNLDWSEATSQTYTALQDSLSIIVRSTVSGNRSYHRIEQVMYEMPLRRIYLELGVAGEIRLLSVREADGTRLDITPATDSAEVVAFGEDETPRWLPWPADAVFQDALLVCASSWAGEGGLAQATLIKYDPRTGIIMQLPLTIKPDDDRGRTVWSRDRLVAQVDYIPGTLQVQSLCDAKGVCWTVANSSASDSETGSTP